MAQYIDCPYCGKTIEDDSCFCDQCGKELLKCPSCGGVGTGKFCASCGKQRVPASSLGSAAPASAPKPQAAQQPNPAVNPPQPQRPNPVQNPNPAPNPSYGAAPAAAAPQSPAYNNPGNAYNRPAVPTTDPGNSGGYPAPGTGTSIPGMGGAAVSGPTRLSCPAMGVSLTLKPGAVIGRVTGDYAMQLGMFQYISGTHARLDCSGPQWTITDMGSRNGTSVSGRPCPPGMPVPFNKGDKIRFANFYEFTVE